MILDDLTERETEVLAFVGQGQSNKEISQQLVINEKTVKNHTGDVFSKLHICARAQAVLHAIRRGLVKV